jgi:hypothetical protein
MSRSAEGYLYQYNLNREARELECHSLKEALELACGGLVYKTA